MPPRARGLFQRAIAESGTYNLEQPTLAAAIVDHEDLSGYTPDADGAVLP